MISFLTLKISLWFLFQSHQNKARVILFFNVRNIWDLMKQLIHPYVQENFNFFFLSNSGWNQYYFNSIPW